MYPSVDNVEAIAEIDRRLQLEPSPIPGITSKAIVEAVKICRDQAIISFKSRNFVQSSGCGMGPPDSCDYSDIWMSGPITNKIIDTSPTPVHGFGFYRDDGLGLIDESHAQTFIEHLNTIHPNLNFETKVDSCGEHLDLFIYIKDGHLHTRPYSKPTSTHIYLHPSSCHDPAVFKGIYKGVGQRLRLNTSEDHLMEDIIKEYAGYFAASGHSYSKAFEGLKHGAMLLDANGIPQRREDVIKNKASSHTHSFQKKRSRCGSKAYWTSTFDPRVIHPRRIISKNYHIIRDDPTASQLFPRKDLVASSRRLKNLSELISPTVPSDLKPGPQKKKPDLDWGSFQCKKRRGGGSCDMCSHLIECKEIISVVNGRKFTIRQHLSHDHPNFWFIYIITDTACNKQYCGSSIDILKRWANHKSSCNRKSPTVTGLSAHFSKGCPAYNAPSQPHLKITLIDGFPAPPPKAGHSKKKSCSCHFCRKFIDLENRWICRLGLLDPPNGLNSREDIALS